MNITVCNFARKSGKSLLAHQLILEYGFRGVEIDPTGTLAKNLPEWVDKVRSGERHLESGFINTIFDFGGFDDPKLDEAIEQSSVIIVPFLLTGKSIASTLATLQKIKIYRLPVLLVANRVTRENKKWLPYSKEQFYQVLEYEPLLHVVIESEGFQIAWEYNESVRNLTRLPGRKGDMFQPLASCIHEIYNNALLYGMQYGDLEGASGESA